MWDLVRHLDFIPRGVNLLPHEIAHGTAKCFQLLGNGRDGAHFTICSKFGINMPSRLSAFTRTLSPIRSCVKSGAEIPAIIRTPSSRSISPTAYGVSLNSFDGPRWTTENV